MTPDDSLTDRCMQPFDGASLPTRFRDALLALLVGFVNGVPRHAAFHAFFMGLSRELPDARVVLALDGGAGYESAPDTLVRCTQGHRCKFRHAAIDGACELCPDCLGSGHGRAVRAIGDAVLVLDVALPAAPTLMADLDVIAGTVRAALTRRDSSAAQGGDAANQSEALTRELHDSVAQQLGFMSFLVARLQQQDATGNPMLAELRAMTTHLQRQVRELITSARLTLDGRSLQQALADSVAEFSRRCDVVFELDNRVPDLRVDPRIALHILQIVREALSNVVRHAQARHAWIALRVDGNGLQVSVVDDGIGIGKGSADVNHYGLDILRERAAAIGGRIAIETGAFGGTRVVLFVQEGTIFGETP
ncbi:ATP-binding protein [Burkholderia cenocepacia]|uniref:ATP-binding protein n=1 Tax=Burkholderia cenocepacia TaxID=95486 RepID=UPI002B253DAC|nr:ATP-binding protein [Burkholderia cenocepacia]MEB2603425.1 ATP-binding protein [Burkholderia cenocepacia]